MRTIVSLIEDHVLRFIQKRCKHPDHMVMHDLLEGDADGIAVMYCNRCGSVRRDWKLHHGFRKYTDPDTNWRTPDPFLWHGWRPGPASKPQR
jgi:hypothetical protein